MKGVRAECGQPAMHLFPGQERVLWLLEGRPDQVEALGDAPGLGQLLRCPLAGPPCIVYPPCCFMELMHGTVRSSGPTALHMSAWCEMAGLGMAAEQEHARQTSPCRRAARGMLWC